MQRRTYPKLYSRALRERLRRATLVLVPRPLGGWVYSLRTAHQVSGKELGRRMGISRQAVADLEVRELNGTASLGALARCAAALDARLVYYFRPNHAVVGRAPLHAGVK